MQLLHVTDVLPEPDFACDPMCLERGKHVHTACDLLDRGILDWSTVHESWQGYVRAWEQCQAESGMKIIDSEQRIKSPVHGYCGRLDRVVQFPKLRRPSVLDIKTGVPAHTVGLQVAAYQAAYTVQCFRAVVQLNSDGTYKLTCENTPGQKLFSASDFRVFIAYLTTRKWELAHGLWSPTPREDDHDC